MRINRVLLIATLIVRLSPTAWAQSGEIVRLPSGGLVGKIPHVGSTASSPSQPSNGTSTQLVLGDGTPIEFHHVSWPPPLHVLSMKLLAPRVGWALATGRRLFWTNDNGANWKDITPAGAKVGAVFFLDTRRGWATIERQDPGMSESLQFDVATTADAGANWSITHTATSLKDYPTETGDTIHKKDISDYQAGPISFATPLDGWMGVQINGLTMNSWWNFLMVTSDGGTTWRLAALPPILRDVDLLMLSPTEGWMVGDEDVPYEKLYVTRDGAKTWKEVSLRAPKEILPARQPAYDLPVFESGTHGFLPVTYSGGDGVNSAAVLFVTDDSGRSWHSDRMLTQLEPKNRALMSSAISGSSWISAAVSGDIWTGAGQFGERPTLTTLGSGTVLKARFRGGSRRPGYFHTRQLSFATPTQGWVLVGDGQLLTTSDGGTVWDDVTPGPKRESSTAHSPPRPLATEGVAPRFSKPSRLLGSLPAVGVKLSMHEGFDTSATLEAGTPGEESEMQEWWYLSPYYNMGIYLNGANGHRNKDPNLNGPEWIFEVAGMGWGLMPLWYGPQDRCTLGAKDNKRKNWFPTGTQAAQRSGLEEASRAVVSAELANVPPGSPIYYDLENYNSSCHATELGSSSAIAFLSEWIAAVQAHKFKAGVYFSAATVNDINALTSQPDYFWVAEFNNQDTVWNLGKASANYAIPNQIWTDHQRIHQYNKDKYEGQTYGGTNDVLVDHDILDTTVAGGATLPKPFLSYSKIDLPSAGSGPINYAYGINDPDVSNGDTYGTIVGYNLQLGGPNQAGFADGFIDRSGSGGGVSTLDCSDAVKMFPLNINNLGDIVGYYIDGSDNYHSFMLTGSDQSLQCDQANGIFAINDAGWTAGATPWNIGQTSWESFLNSDRFYDFPIGSGYFSQVAGLNGFGDVVGNYASDTEAAGFVEQPGSGDPAEADPIFPSNPFYQDWDFSNLSNNQDVAGYMFDDDTGNQYGFILSSLGGADSNPMSIGSGDDLGAWHQRLSPDCGSDIHGRRLHSLGDVP